MLVRISLVVVLVLALPTSFATAQEETVPVIPDKPAGVVGEKPEAVDRERPQAAQEQPAAAATNTTELQKVNAACRTILNSSKADETAKANATKWGECVRTRQWGKIKARYVGMGKNADSSWWVRVQNFKGEQTDIPYNSLDAASQQVLGDVWQLTFSIPKSAEPIIRQQQAEAAKRDKDIAAKAEKRKANLAAPFQAPDKDGYRVWTNLVGDTIEAKIDSFVSRRITISRKGEKFYLDGKDESQLDDCEKASLAARLKILKDTNRSQFPEAQASGTRPKRPVNVKGAQDSAQMDPHVIFLCKDQTTVEWPIIALRGSNDRTVGKVDDFTTVTTVLAMTLKANGEFAPLGFALGRRSYSAVSVPEGKPTVKKAAFETKSFFGKTEEEADAKAQKWLDEEAAVGAKEGYSVKCGAKSTLRGYNEWICSVSIERKNLND